MTLAPGTRLGPYEIVGQIGAGGMGEVWKAKDTRLGREVAIKVLPAAFAEEPDRLKRFEQEARMVAALSHPNVLAIFDVGTHEGSPYLVSELLKGGTLRERLSGGPLPIAKALDIAIQVARGLAAAHDKGIIHRDLKPENIFLTHDAVKILDFGLAKQAQAVQQGSQSELPTRDFRNATQEGAILGTLGYMSPEQVRGDPVDARSDLFALGVVIYEMLSGRQAFHGRTQADTLSAILREEPPELDSGLKVPPLLECVLRSCLSKEVEGRLRSAHDLAFALQSAMEAGTSSTGAVALAQTSAGVQNRLRRFWPWVAGLLLVTVLGILWTMRARPVLDTPITSLAVLPLQNYSGDAQQDFFVDGMTDALIADLAQIKALKVISRNSVMQYKGAKRSLPEIAKELGVQGILEGSVLRVGNKVRITAQLIDARQDRHVWASNYERDMTDVMSLQREVVREIASQIRVQVTAKEKGRLSVSHPVDPEVYDTALKARAVVESATNEAEIRKAMAMFQMVVAKDPAYAPGWAGLAEATWTLALSGFEVVPPEAARDKAIAAAERALTLDPDLPEAHNARAIIAMDGEWDFAKTKLHYEKALELRPGYANCHNNYAQLLIGELGRFDDAQRHLDRARELDPFSPWNGLNNIWLLLAMGQPEKAVQVGEQLRKQDPNNWLIFGQMGFARLALKQYGEAVHDFETAQKLYGPRHPFILGRLAQAYGLAGRREDARKILRELQAASLDHYVSPRELAIAHTGAGEMDEAFRLLDRALAARTPGLVMMVQEYDGMEVLLRADSRWPGFKDRIRRAIRWPEGMDPGAKP